MKQILHATIALGFAAALPAIAQAQSGTSQNQANTHSGQTPSQTNAASRGPVAQKLQQDLEQSGFKNVRVMPESFLVRANDKDGHPVMMIVNPDSLTAVTAISSSNPSGSSGSSNALGSSGSNSSGNNPNSTTHK
jgi:hypothetical protein